MEIGIISDSHDNLINLRKALVILKDRNIQTIIHCGDFCTPFVLEELKEINEVHCIFGNTADRFTLTKVADSLEINLHGDTAKLEIEGRKILVNHYPDIARAFAFTGEFDLVLYGHNHTAKEEKINNTLLVNPGAIIGRNSPPSFAIYNTESNKIEIIQTEHFKNQNLPIII